MALNLEPVKVSKLKFYELALDTHTQSLNGTDLVIMLTNTCFIEVAFQSTLNKRFKFLAAGLLANTNLNLNLGWTDILCQLQGS